MSLSRLVRQLHIYTSLAFFLPLFLFAVSGFMLNHRWAIWETFATRVESEEPVAVQIPTSGTDLDKAHSVLEQLNVGGEINSLTLEPDKNLWQIRTTRPGQWLEIKLNPTTGSGTLKRTDFNAWSIMPRMHTLAGLHSNIPEKKNWVWTKVWSLMMDLTAVATLVLLVTGLYMLTQMTSERRPGLIVLGIGSVVFLLTVWILGKFQL